MTPRRPVVHLLDDLQVGGAQQLVVLFAREAERRGAPVLVVSLQDDADGRVGQELRAAGAEVVCLPRTGGRSGAARQLVALVRLLRGRRPEAMQTHLTMANVLGALSGRLAGVPVVATLHNVRVGDDGNSALALRLETGALRRGVRAVVAVGDVVERAQRERLAPRRAVVVPNATDAGPVLDGPARRRLRQELAGDADTELVVAVGRLVPQKGHDDLLRAFKQVAAARPLAVLVVLGDGPEAPHLHALAADLGAGDRVRFVGTRDDARAVLAAADLYVSAARWEGLPVAMLEAMAAGRAMVVTDVGDVSSVVDRSCALLVPPGAPELLAGEVVALLAEDARRHALGDAAQEQVRARFGVAPWFDRLLEVYGAAR